MHAKTMEGLIGARTNMDMTNVPMRVFKEARRKGDTATMERAMGYVRDFEDHAYQYKDKADEGMKEEAEEAREEEKLAREEAIEKRREERKKAEEQISRLQLEEVIVNVRHGFSSKRFYSIPGTGRNQGPFPACRPSLRHETARLSLMLFPPCQSGCSYPSAFHAPHQTSCLP